MLSGDNSRHLDAGGVISSRLADRWFDALYETPLLFSGILDGLGVVLDANQLSVEGCGFVRDDVIGRPFWECGWWSPAPDVAARVQAWCGQVVSERRAVRVTTPYFTGSHERRMVDMALTPVFGDEAAAGTASHIVATGADITEAWFAQAEHEERMAIEAEALRLVLEARQREVVAAHGSEAQLRARLGRLSAVALELVQAESVEDLTEIIFNRGVPILEAEGGALLVADPAGDPDVLIYRMHRGGRVVRERQPATSPLPGPRVARSGRPIVLADRTAGLGFSPEMARVYDETNLSAWLFVPLSVGRQLIGSLAVAWVDERNITDDDIELVDAFATQCAFALDRIESSRARRRAAGQMRLMVESLQRALLDRPDLPDDITVAARYLPAVHGAQIGGDWYDAFEASSGSTLLSVGDVTGHDGAAAATMAQLRNLIRGLSFDRDEGPAAVLRRLDATLDGLDLPTLATAIVGLIDPPQMPHRAVPRLRWSSAGHPPLLVRLPSGEVEIQLRPADLLIGFDPNAPRSEHVIDLPPGTVALLYTDGLVERRNRSLDDGLDELAKVFASIPLGDLERMCDDVIDRMLDGPPDDDVVVLLVASHGTDRQRSAPV